MKKASLSVTLVFFASFLTAQSIGLDPTFGVNGIVKSDLYHGATNTIVGFNMRVLPDGSIIVGGEKDDEFALRKYKNDGSLDTSFISPTPIFAGYQIGAAIQQDGKILFCDTEKIAPFNVSVIRIDPSGAIDSTFGNAGVAPTFVNHIYFSNLFEQNDGKIVVFGCQDLPTSLVPVAVTRLNKNGSIDSTFANNGQFIKDVSLNNYEFLNAGLQQPDGKLLFTGMAGWRFLLVRLNLNGSLDSTFGVNGIKVETSNSAWADAMELQSDGKIVLTGCSNGQGLFARYNTNGSLDTSFANHGFHYFPETYEGVALSILPDGKILGAMKRDVGLEVAVFMAQLLPNGQRDATFGIDGVFMPGVFLHSRTLELLGNKAILGGQAEDYTLFVLRFTLDLNVGTINPGEQANQSLWIYPNPITGPLTFNFGLSQSAQVSIRLFDMQGKLIQTFAENQRFEAGEQQSQLSCAEQLPSGNYVLTLTVNGENRTSIQVMKR